LDRVDRRRQGTRGERVFVDGPGRGTCHGWYLGSGGPSIDDQGNIYVATGTSGRNGNMGWVFDDSPDDWGQSILQLRDDPVHGFELTGTYTPFTAVYQRVSTHWRLIALQTTRVP
jgi:hypothetical protein